MPKQFDLHQWNYDSNSVDRLIVKFADKKFADSPEKIQNPVSFTRNRLATMVGNRLDVWRKSFWPFNL